MLLNKMYKVLQTQAVEILLCREQNSESLMHIMTTTDRRALWKRGTQRDNQRPSTGQQERRKNK